MIPGDDAVLIVGSGCDSAYNTPCVCSINIPAISSFTMESVTFNI